MQFQTFVNSYCKLPRSVIRALDRIIAERGVPKAIWCDNGPEFISNLLQEWCASMGVRLQYIQPGKATQNAFIERQNWSMRRGLLNAYLFYSLSEVRLMAEEWRFDYNLERSHKSLGYPSQLYPQAVTENPSQIEGNRFVDKELEKPENSNQ